MLSQELHLGDLKRALMGPKLPKSRKSRAKTMIIIDILSRFFSRGTRVSSNDEMKRPSIFVWSETAFGGPRKGLKETKTTKK